MLILAVNCHGVTPIPCSLLLLTVCSLFTATFTFTP
jgi:hypothetical protein